MGPKVALCVLVSLLSSLSFAQRGMRNNSETFNTGNIMVRVVFPNERAAGAGLMVQLMAAGSTSPISTVYTNENGEAGFGNLNVGMYHVVVTGDAIDPSDSGAFEVDARRAAQTQFVSVHGKTNSAQLVGGAPTVSATSLNVPKKAAQEFDKGGSAMAARDWKKAQQHLAKATEIYPQYAAAYSNLGVVYGQLNDPVHQREALEKAVSLDDHFAPALVNLAKIDYRDQKFAETEQLLEKAVRVDPANAQTLTLLAQTDLVNQQYDNAIANARKVHNMPHQHLAIIHYIAARALEFEHRRQDALAELQTFLTEEPDGPRAADARREAAFIHAAR